MINNNMENKEIQPARRKFIWGVGLLSAFGAAGALLKSPFLSKKSQPETKGNTVKMLTQDGRLVEVDMAALTSARKKATNTELQNFIKK